MGVALPGCGSWSFVCSATPTSQTGSTPTEPVVAERRGRQPWEAKIPSPPADEMRMTRSSMTSIASTSTWTSTPGGVPTLGQITMYCTASPSICMSELSSASTTNRAAGPSYPLSPRPGSAWHRHVVVGHYRLCKVGADSVPRRGRLAGGAPTPLRRGRASARENAAVRPTAAKPCRDRRTSSAAAAALRDRRGSGQPGGARRNST